MLKLEDLVKRTQVVGIDPAGPVAIVSVDAIGEDVVTVWYKSSDGAPTERMLFRSEAVRTPRTRWPMCACAGPCTTCDRQRRDAAGPGPAQRARPVAAVGLVPGHRAPGLVWSGLVESGQLTQRHGAGGFVVERIQHSFSRLTSFTDDLRERGLNPRSEFFERSVGEVTPKEAMALNLSPGSGVVRMYRVRYGGESPLAVERTLVPHALLPNPESVENSLYEALQPHGNRPVRALQHLRAEALEGETARLLQLPEGSPGLLIERRAFLADGRVVESTRSFYRGDAYDFVAELHSE